MFEDKLVKGCVIAVGDKLLSFLLIESTSLFEKAQESAATVVEVGEPMLGFCGAERVNIEADVFAVLAVTVAFEGTDLIERNA